MKIKRIVANVATPEPNAAQRFYGDILGLELLMDQGFIVTYGSREKMAAQVSFVSEGGSGAPLFGPSGRVIGVNFAVFTENQASNFAVPSRFAVSLLERTGWTAPPKDSKDEGAGQSSSYTP